MLRPMERHGRIGEALTWASRIIAVGLVMFLPAVAGSWADERFGTGFLGAAGLVVGFVLGLMWLVRLGQTPGAR